MNGDIARWLRILGYDCLYLKGTRNLDKKIVNEAKRRGRIVLTADRGLFRKCVSEGVKAIYTLGESREDRLAYLIQRLGLDTSLERRPIRCSLCNDRLRRIGSKEISGTLPPKLVERYNEFWICLKCDKVYWQGSHWVGIKRIIELARFRAEEEKN